MANTSSRPSVPKVCSVTTSTASSSGNRTSARSMPDGSMIPIINGARPARRSSIKTWSSCSATFRRIRLSPLMTSKTASASGSRRAKRFRRGARRLIYEGRTRAELITNATKAVRSYDPMTGKELWKLSGNPEITATTPVVGQELNLPSANSYSPNQPIYAIRPGASGDISLKDGKERMSTSRGANSAAALICRRRSSTAITFTRTPIKVF